MGAPIPRFVIVRAGATIFGLLLVIAGVFFAVRYFQRQSEALDRLEVEREEQAKAAHIQDRDPKDTLGREKSGSTATSKPGAAAAARKAQDHKIVSEAEQAMKAAKQKEVEYENAYNEFRDAGMVRSASLPSEDSIRDRMEMLDRLDAANLALDAALKTVRENALVGFRKQGLTERQVLSAEGSSPAGAQLEALIAMRACDRELIAEFKQILDLLEKNWGAWKADTGDKVLFDKRSEANRYNALRGQILDSSNRQHALQTEAAKALAPSTPRPAVRYAPDFIGPPGAGK